MLSESRTYAYGAGNGTMRLDSGVYPFNSGLAFEAMPHR